MLEVVPGIRSWSVWNEERGIPFNGFLVEGPDGPVLVDPPPPDESSLREIRAQGVRAILLTNLHHGRATPLLREATGAPVLAPEADAAGFPFAVDRTYRGGDRLPGGLRAIHVPDSKTPGETAFHLPAEAGRRGGVLIVGDAVLGKPEGKLSLLPAQKFRDVEAAKRGLRVLLAPDYDALLVGDGHPIPRGGKAALRAFLAEMGVA